MTILAGLEPGLNGAGSRLLDRLIPYPSGREQAKRLLLHAEGQQALAEMQLSLSAILADAGSADSWTSRACPTFLYAIYGVILVCVIASIVGIWWPEQVFQAPKNLSNLLGAIPESLWWLFGAGYLGYTGARSFDKWRAPGHSGNLGFAQHPPTPSLCARCGRGIFHSGLRCQLRPKSDIGLWSGNGPNVTANGR